MAKETLAVKYRPSTFDAVVEQDSTKVILQQQLESKEFKNAYLFVGGAGTGKTTCARIFANEINEHKGHPIELDAASNSSVDDARLVIQQAKTKSLDSEYKIFIIDECHSLSNQAWQAFLKLIEEPPAKSIFIFCTTNPEKIPKTILSRVQRYDFKRISQDGIEDRLLHILNHEDDLYDLDKSGIENDYDVEAISYIAKLADGGMRDAITMLDKCLSLSSELTVENVVSALGVVDYDIMAQLVSNIINYDANEIISIIEEVHGSGKDLKQFVRQLINFVLDIQKYCIFKSYDYICIPHTDWADGFLTTMLEYEYAVSALLDVLLKLNSDIKYDTAPKYLIEAMLIRRL